MRNPIQFDDPLRRRTVEIRDIWPKRHLPAELQATKLVPP
jgi:hypothetical protein